MSGFNSSPRGSGYFPPAVIGGQIIPNANSRPSTPRPDVPYHANVQATLANRRPVLTDRVPSIPHYVVIVGVVQNSQQLQYFAVAKYAQDAGQPERQFVVHADWIPSAYYAVVAANLQNIVTGGWLDNVNTFGKALRTPLAVPLVSCLSQFTPPRVSGRIGNGAAHPIGHPGLVELPSREFVLITGIEAVQGQRFVLWTPTRATWGQEEYGCRAFDFYSSINNSKGYLRVYATQLQWKVNQPLRNNSVKYFDTPFAVPLKRRSGQFALNPARPMSQVPGAGTIPIREASPSAVGVSGRFDPFLASQRAPTPIAGPPKPAPLSRGGTLPVLQPQVGTSGKREEPPASPGIWFRICLVRGASEPWSRWLEYDAKNCLFPHCARIFGSHQGLVDHLKEGHGCGRMNYRCQDCKLNLQGTAAAESHLGRESHKSNVQPK